MKVFSVAYPFSVFSFLITSAATSCAATVESNPLGCIEAEEPDTDYFPDKVEIKYSTLWRVTYHNTYKVLFNDATETVYLLYQCGTTPPDPEQVVQQGQAPYINSTLSIPLKGFALQTTTSLAHIEWLGLSSTFKAYLGSRSSISSPCINDRFDSGDLVHIPDWQNETELQMGYAQTGIDPQDMVPPVNPTGSFLTADLNNKVFIAAYKEQTNNALGEWHKYYAVLTNTEKKATEDFEGISSRFECTARNARFLQELAPDDAPKPKVVWAEFAPWCNNAWSIVNCPDEPCEFIEKCDAELLQGQGSVSVEGKDYCEGDFTTEEFVEFAKDADYWIYPGHGTHYWELVYADHPELDQLKAVQNKQVFDTVRTGLSTWYEHRMTEYGKCGLYVYFVPVK